MTINVALFPLFVTLGERVVTDIVLKSTKSSCPSAVSVFVVFPPVRTHVILYRPRGAEEGTVTTTDELTTFDVALYL